MNKIIFSTALILSFITNVSSMWRLKEYMTADKWDKTTAEQFMREYEKNKKNSQDAKKRSQDFRHMLELQSHKSYTISERSKITIWTDPAKKIPLSKSWKRRAAKYFDKWAFFTLHHSEHQSLQNKFNQMLKLTACSNTDKATKSKEFIRYAIEHKEDVFKRLNFIRCLLNSISNDNQHYHESYYEDMFNLCQAVTEIHRNKLTQDKSTNSDQNINLQVEPIIIELEESIKRIKFKPRHTVVLVRGIIDRETGA